MKFDNHGPDSNTRSALIFQGLLKLDALFEQFYRCPGVEWPQSEQAYCELITVLAHRSADSEAMELTLPEWADSAREDLERKPVSIEEIRQVLNRPLRDVLFVQRFDREFF